MPELPLAGNAARRLPVVFREAVALCEPALLTGAALVRDGDSLEVHRHAYATTQDASGQPRAKLSGKGAQLGLSLVGGRVALIAAGKAAGGMALAVHQALRDRLGSALLVLPRGTEPPALPDVQVVFAEHPVPGAGSVAAAESALALARSLPPDDLLVVAVSGGTSALLAAPAAGVTLEEKVATTRALLASGADIRAFNAVRKHLSRIKGGKLAAETRASVLALLLSDVVGDPPDVIGSGPVSPDPTTYADALRVCEGLEIPGAVRRHLEAGARGERPETPKPGDALFTRVRTAVIAGPDHLRAAAVTSAARLNFQGAGTEPPSAGEDVEALAPRIAATARDALARTGAKPARKALAWVWVREPSVRVTVASPGRGGRSAHLALLVAREIAGLDRVSFLAAGSDGIDGNSDAAGAVVDGTTWAKAEAAGLDPAGALARFDSATLHAALGTAIVTGPTGTNLLDLHMLAIEAPAGAS